MAAKPLLQRINQTMPVYRDCTLGELIALLGLCMASCLFAAGLLCAIIAGSISLGLIIGLPISFVGVPQTAKILQRHKVGKPTGYYWQLCRLRLEDKGLLTTPFIRRLGPWSITRDDWYV